jgi:hypothetical protein
MTKFAYVVTASNCSRVQCMTGLVLASSRDEAEGKIKWICQVTFPYGRGWDHHCSSAIPLDGEIIDPETVRPFES